MGGCAEKSKCALICYSITSLCFGAAPLGLGIYFKVHGDASNVATVAGLDFYNAVCDIMISAGTVMIVLGCLGFCGAIKENKYLLGLYLIVLLALFIVLFGVGIWGFVTLDTIEQDIQKSLKDSTPIKYVGPDNAFSQSVIAIEYTFDCCGFNIGCQDWENGEAYGCGCNVSSAKCGIIPQNCTIPGGADRLIYTTGCYKPIYNAVVDSLKIVAGVAIGIGLFKLFGMIFAILMRRNLKKGRGYY